MGRPRKKKAEELCQDEDDARDSARAVDDMAEVTVLDEDARQDINNFFPDDLVVPLDAQEAASAMHTREIGSLFDSGDDEADEVED